MLIVPMTWGQLSENGTKPATTYVSLPDHTRYQYLIDLNGGGYSGRLKFLVHTRRLLFVNDDRDTFDWVTSQLAAWVHYVPVKSDASDIVDKIDWANRYPKQVQTIIAAMDKWAVQFSSYHATFARMQDILASGGCVHMQNTHCDH